MTMKTSSKKWQKIRKIKGLRQFVTWYPRHVSENPGYEGAKEMLLVEEVDQKEFLTGLFHAMYDELPLPKPKKKK